MCRPRTTVSGRERHRECCRCLHPERRPEPIEGCNPAEKGRITDPAPAEVPLIEPRRFRFRAAGGSSLVSMSLSVHKQGLRRPCPDGLRRTSLTKSRSPIEAMDSSPFAFLNGGLAAGNPRSRSTKVRQSCRGHSLQDSALAGRRDHRRVAGEIPLGDPGPRRLPALLAAG